MSAVLVPLVEHEELRSPVSMVSAPVDLSAPRRTSTSRQAWSLFVIVTSLVGSLAAASAVSAVWQAGRATRALSLLPTEDLWTDASITRLGSQSIGLGAEDGRKWELGLNFNETSVFQKGGVLNITHLRLGQQVKVLSGMHDGKALARVVEIKPRHVLSAVP